MDQYAALPTAAQLDTLGTQLGHRLTFSHRLDGGLGCTMDVLHVEQSGEQVILRRYWLPAEGEVDPSLAEVRALELAAEHGVPAPRALWRDQSGLFPERAIVISWVDGTPLLEPEDPFGWAAQLAQMLVAVHRIEVGQADSFLFPVLAPGEDDHVSREAVAENPKGGALLARLEEENHDLVDTEPVYVHHDYWAGNTLWLGSRLVAVVDWEGGSIGDPAIDVAYCSFDMRLLGMDEAAAHFVDVYRHESGRTLENLEYWNLMALCRPMPDVAIWVPGWNAMGVGISIDYARAGHDRLIAEALAREHR